MKDEIEKEAKEYALQVYSKPKEITNKTKQSLQKDVDL